MHLPHRTPRAALAAGLLALAAACATPSAAAPAEPPPPADPITAEEIQAHVDVLSSDAFAGRGAATDGERLAADYLVSVLETIDGLEPAGDDGGWFQDFAIPPTAVPDDIDHATARNVLARLPGADPDLAGEVVVLGAHYDHVGPRGLHGGSMGGIGEIHNGADDNASGSALLLEVAAALASSTRPRRTVVFQWYSGEELGLLGSRHWVDHPTFPLEDVVAMINTDMVGRLLGGTLLVGGTGSSPQLEAIVARAEGSEGLQFVLDPPGAAPSDNASFYLAGVPVLFLFTGVHEDYHRPTDDVDKLNAGGAAKVSRLAYRLVRAIDALDERPAFRDAPGMANYWVPALDWGLTFVEDDGELRLAVLEPDSPGGRARDAEGRALAENDVLLRVDGRVPRGLAQLEAWLKETDDKRSPRTFEFLRDEEELLRVAVRPEVR